MKPPKPWRERKIEDPYIGPLKVDPDLVADTIARAHELTEIGGLEKSKAGLRRKRKRGAAYG
jgi:hypothetical protein